MNTNTGVKQIVRWVTLGALFLIPLTPLIVASSFFFPFITGKAFFFRIVAEIAIVGWVALAFIDKDYRPRFSWVGVAALAFVAWMFVADAFALNAVKAFWSNFERMEGWVLLAHLLGLFYAASAVLRVEKKWRAWFITSLGVSLVIAGYALLQLAGVFAIHQGSTRIDATLGNSAYLAIYFLFNVFIALWLALTPRKDSGQAEKKNWLKWSLISLALLEAVLLFFTETRGAMLGFIGALALAAALTALTAGKHARRFAAGALLLLLLLAGSFYLARNSSFIQDNNIFRRIATISLTDGQTRFTIWHMAFEGALERPLTGWGQEGFNYIFNKYYDPSLYAQEPWFDRAHNAFIDWLTAGGLPAFLLYLSLFGTAIMMLWRSSELSRPERIALTAALAGYAVHNLFVFDNLYSYVYFFMILALIDSRSSHKATKGTAQVAWLDRLPELGTDESTTYVIPIAAAALFGLVWFVNVPGLRAVTQLITAISPSDSPAKNIATFEDLLSRHPFASQEIREQLISFAGSAVQSTQVSNEDKQKVVTLAINEMKDQVASYPTDARERLQLAYAYRVVGDSASALKEMQNALLLSPNKEQMLIEAGATAWDTGDIKLTQEYFNKAYMLGPQFTDLAAYAAAGNIVAGDEAAANKILLAAFGTTTVDNDVLTVAYYRTKDWPRLIAVWKMRTENPNTTANTWFGLAAAYYMAGDKTNAIKVINTTVAKYPEAAASGAAAIKQIQAGPAGQ